MNASPKIIRLQMEEIGRSLHGARLVKKFTLTRLSRLSGVPVSLLDRYEMGASRMRVGDLLKIALAMRLDIKDVLFEDWD